MNYPIAQYGLTTDSTRPNSRSPADENEFLHRSTVGPATDLDSTCLQESVGLAGVARTVPVVSDEVLRVQNKESI